ncbi:hypothetical protein A464_90 [Salmonella bongori N268-08]|uniref:Uncharacterized protein n=1 Tax=Salmonella bongori N268-08 TaxID=1197719 RepID=S5ML74_SALBN|nr:hypothetical protein A464_90 [Salmonella bongori N268-08]
MIFHELVFSIDIFNEYLKGKRITVFLYFFQEGIFINVIMLMYPVDTIIL